MNIIHPRLKLKGYKIVAKCASKPKYRFLNALEQCVEKYNTDYLYLVLHCKKQENIGFRIRKCNILEELTVEKYDKETEIYEMEIYYNF